jgi:hypothetical protein
VSHQHSVTCDACGKTVEASAGTFGDCYAPGWLRVVGTGPIITADMPHEYRSKQPDLCSWKCVAEYASQRVRRETVIEPIAPPEP